MLEIPEANTLAIQINSTIIGKTVDFVSAASSPHKFAWYHGDPAEYQNRLLGNQVVAAYALGGMVEVELNHAFLLFSDGVNLRYLKPDEALPLKHQLLITFNDCSVLVASVQMYGGLSCWTSADNYENPYYLAAKGKPSPLNDKLFEQVYFDRILTGAEVQNLSLKAALATQQRFPGLGNGVLQDILWKAKLSPRRKVNSLSENERQGLYKNLKLSLFEMTSQGGRDTEKDLFGNPGGYRVVMSSRNKGTPCPVCGTLIRKEAYLGGSVYYCSECQKT